MPANNDGKVWHDAVRWIKNNGGYVHPKLHYDGIHRQVYFGKPTATAQSDASEAVVAETVDAGTTLLKIPDSCLVTLHAVESDGSLFGKSLFGAVHSISNKEDEKRTGSGEFNINMGINDGSMNDDDDNLCDGLYNDSQDVILALYLAYLQQQLCNANAACEQLETNTTTHAEHTTGTEQSADDPTAPWLFYQPYLATLPSSTNEYRCNLPRQWSAETLHSGLQGTSLYKRVLKEQDGIKREYELVKNAWLKQQAANNVQNDGSNGSNTEVGSGNSLHKSAESLFPSFEHYDNMMAALTSRGFAGLGYDGVDAFIPMLDLLNHVRGRHPQLVDDGSSKIDTADGGHSVEKNAKQTENSEENKPSEKGSHQNYSSNSTAIKGGPDVRYERYEDGESRTVDDGPLLKRQRNENGTGVESSKGNGGVRVSTAHSLHFGSALQMTYGAKGNVALLGRYGFCIPNNLEPDGSCNDVLEVKIKANEQPIKLQRGPKSYSYGPFVKAIELCHDKDDYSGDGNETKKVRAEHSDELEEEFEDGAADNGGLEAFLDSCDNEFEDDDDEENEGNDGDEFNDYLYGGSSSLTTIHANNRHENSMKKDIHAIEKLKKILHKVREDCEKNPLLGGNDCNSNAKESTNMNTDEDQYCAILIRSEIQTVNFYLAAADLLLHRLTQCLEKLPSSENKNVTKSKENFEMDDASNDTVTNEQIKSVVSAYVSIRYPQMIL